MKVVAPAKLILSGEHAVLYGQPALAMAVNRYTTATVTAEKEPYVLFDLPDLAHHSRLDLSSLKQIKDKIQHHYQRFVQGELRIAEVLQGPFELVHFAMGMLAQAFPLTLSPGMRIQVQSDIPMGCGMGSSATTILSVMQAISSYLHLPLSPQILLPLALTVENVQHGLSSGLDLHVACHGGCWYVQGSERQARPLPTLPLYLVHTGTPSVTTGQCVEKVAAHFQSSSLSEDFGAVTRSLDTALQQACAVTLGEALRANHQLLTHIGVVPERVQQFISQVHALSGAAKICGAGAIAGDHAGVVLVALMEQTELASLCKRFDYSFTAVVGDERGLHVL